ncbi:unnamed protein product, partial [Meganyctiphanes norvegica]
QSTKMFATATAAVLLLTAWTAQGTPGIPVNTTGQGTPDILLNTTGQPRDCQDLIHQGNTYEGHYIVYPVENEPTITHCSKEDGFQALPSNMGVKQVARNCLDLLHDGITDSGPAIIYPYLEDNTNPPVLVRCDQQTDGGGWTVIQKRYDGTEDFYRSWSEYADGFGSIAQEHHLGNEVIAAITGQSVNELRVDLEAWDGATAFAHYQMFHVDSADKEYRMVAGLFDGTAGDSLYDNVGQAFTTFDDDNGDWSSNCADAELRYGAWWYPNSCGRSNLNGRWYPSAEDDGGNYGNGMLWYTFRRWDSLKTSTMMIRPYSWPVNTKTAAGPHDTHKPVAI